MPYTQTAPKPIVLVVDDTPVNLQLMQHALAAQFSVQLAHNAQEGLQLLEDGLRPDIILLDVMMPEMDGYEMCTRLKDNPLTAPIPVLFLTAKNEVEDEVRGFAVGAVDFITKPSPVSVVRARVKTHYELKLAQDALQQRNRILQSEVAVLESGIRALASMNEVLGKDASQRLVRIQGYVTALSDALRTQPGYAEQFGPDWLREKMIKASVLYDIGKIGISNHILDKPGPLDTHEWATMQTHAELGGQALQSVISEVVSSVEPHLLHMDPQGHSPLAFLEMARDMALSHHEKWDGSGYPLGLAGQDIPPCARLVALADVYDALLSRRAHKAPMERDEVAAWIRQESGTRFDPLVVEAFNTLEPALYAIWEHHTESWERS